MSGIPTSVINWLAAGERGISSNTIVSHIWGLKHDRFGPSHPHDPADLQRCLQLLDASPETKERFSEMQTCSPQWRALLKQWDELERLFLSEAGNLKWSNRIPATQTYFAMQECIDHAPVADGEVKQ